MPSFSKPEQRGFSIKSMSPEFHPAGDHGPDGVPLRSIVHPPGLIEHLANAIKSGKLSLKPKSGTNG